MQRLGDLCSLIRSKNAGPFYLTFDIMFNDQANYDQVKKSNIISKSLVSTLYKLEEGKIQLVFHDAAQAIKISIPRPIFQCEPGDSDCYGGQQYVPLQNILI
jgi:hypothetical protein